MAAQEIIVFEVGGYGVVAIPVRQIISVEPTTDGKALVRIPANRYYIATISSADFIKIMKIALS